LATASRVVVEHGGVVDQRRERPARVFDQLDRSLAVPRG
jgi:hypothetical protein